jgi:hypothetical protein
MPRSAPLPALTFACGLVVPTLAAGQSVPMVGETCPRGYWPKRSYCVPVQKDARPAVPLVGKECPFMYDKSGSYCLGPPRAPHAVVRNESCPIGYRRSGRYCVGWAGASPTISRKHFCPDGYESTIGAYCVPKRRR